MRLLLLLYGVSLFAAVFASITRLEEKNNQKFDVPSQSRLFEAKIDVFINTLRTFVSPETFDVKTFDSNVGTLAAALFELRKFRLRLGSDNKIAGEKLEFAKEKFRDMVVVTNWKIRHSGQGKPQERMLSACTELNVLLLTLQDSLGKPYYRVNGYESFLKKYKSIYAQLEDQAEEFAKSDDITKWTVDLMLHNVKASILSLEPKTGMRGY